MCADTGGVAGVQSRILGTRLQRWGARLHLRQIRPEGCSFEDCRCRTQSGGTHTACLDRTHAKRHVAVGLMTLTNGLELADLRETS